MKIELDNNLGLNPCPVALVSSGNMEKSNIATIAWTGILNSEPMIVYVSIRPSRFSNEIIKNTQEFCINLPSAELVKIADFCGTKSGRDLDKFKECNLNKIKSDCIESPYIEECPINLECRVLEVKKYASHEVFIAEVVKTHCSEEILGEDENVDFKKANLLSFAGKKYFANNEVVGYRGCGVK